MKNLFKLFFTICLTINIVSCEDDVEIPDPVINPVASGTIAVVGEEIVFEVNDNVADKIAADRITLTGNVGNVSQWIVTDLEGKILGLPQSKDDEEEAFTKVDFDGAGEGNCLLWHLSANGSVGGLKVGSTTKDFNGIYQLSNSITVVRKLGANSVLGGTLEGGPFSFEVLDGAEDKIADGAITLSQELGETFQWIVTDAEGVILGLPGTYTAVDFDQAGLGTCLIWSLSYRGDLEGLEVGGKTGDIKGNYALSNSIEVARVEGANTVKGGKLEGGPFEFVIDGEEDKILDESIVLTDNVGATSQWIVTDENGLILGLPALVSDVNFDGAGTGTCFIWNVSYYGAIEGAEVGKFTSDLSGLFELSSNSIEVVRRTKNILELAMEDPNFSSLVAALTRDDLTTDFVSILSGDGPITAFAPNNAAFDALINELDGVNTLDEIPVEVLEAVLRYHAIAGTAYTSDMLPSRVSTIGEGVLEIVGSQITDAQDRVSNIITPDIEASNGVIHEIDKVLLP